MALAVEGEEPSDIPDNIGGVVCWAAWELFGEEGLEGGEFGDHLYDFSMPGPEDVTPTSIDDFFGNLNTFVGWAFEFDLDESNLCGSGHCELWCGDTCATCGLCPHFCDYRWTGDRCTVLED